MRERENSEIRAAIVRFLRAYAIRVGNADEWDLQELIALELELQEAIGTAVTMQRKLWNKSWADIALATGTTRQAAHKRWADFKLNIDIETLKR